MFEQVWRELADVTVDFCNSTPLHGFQFMVRRDISKIERLLWTLLVLSFVGFSVYCSYYVYLDYYTNPTVTSLKDNNYPISKVPLPGIAICSTNKISMRRATKLAQVLSERLNASVKDILDQIKSLGDLYEYKVPDEEKQMRLQAMVDEIVTVSEKYQNLRMILYELSVPCEELLVECTWFREVLDCTKLFRMRLTSDGFCCTFNYNKRHEDAKKSFENDPDIMNETFDAAEFNHVNGLKVLINNMEDDYFYNNFWFDGVNVKFFNGKVFPDSTTSGVEDVFVGAGTEAFLTIDVTYIKASSDLETLSLDRRKCTLGEDDVRSPTFSECILDCKLKAMKALCSCVSFNYYISTVEKICDFFDLPCLNKYKAKLSTLYPTDTDSRKLDREKEDSIKCSCYQSCDRVVYSVYTNYAKFKHNEKPELEETHTYLHIFYGKETMNVYETDLNQHWFEILSSIGGICGILIGLSITNLVEVCYFFALFLRRAAKILWTSPQKPRNSKK